MYGAPSCAPEVVDRHDVRVVEGPAARASCSKRFKRSASCENDAGQHLDRDVASEARVARAIDLAHPARADGREDLVGTEPGSGGECHFEAGGLTRSFLLQALDDVEVRETPLVGIAVELPVGRDVDRADGDDTAGSGGMSSFQRSFLPRPMSSSMTRAGTSPRRRTRSSAVGGKRKGNVPGDQAGFGRPAPCERIEVVALIRPGDCRELSVRRHPDQTSDSPRERWRAACPRRPLAPMPSPATGLVPGEQDLRPSGRKVPSSTRRPVTGKVFGPPLRSGTGRSAACGFSHVPTASRPSARVREHCRDRDAPRVTHRLCGHRRSSPVRLLPRFLQRAESARPPRYPG